MARRPAESADGAGDRPSTVGEDRDAMDNRPEMLPDGLPEAKPTTRGDGSRARWRVLLIVLAAVVVAGVLIGGLVAIVVQVGVGGAAQDSTAGESSGSSPTDPAVAAVATDFETFARGLDGVSSADDAVSVVAILNSAGVPRGVAEVALADDGWDQVDALSAALTGWVTAAEADGRGVLDVRLMTEDGSVDLSRDSAANAPRLAVVHAVAGDDEVDTFVIGSSRVDLILVPGADQTAALDRWRALVADLAPAMSVTVRSADVDGDDD